MSTLSGPAKMLVIYIDETDKLGNMPLYEAILRRLRKRDCAGATVMRGIMGYGAQHRIYGATTLGIPENRPVTITAVESEEKIDNVLQEIADMVQEGMVVTVDAYVQKYTAGRPKSGE